MRFSIDDRKLIWLVVIVVAVLFRQPLAATPLTFYPRSRARRLLEPLVSFLQVKARMPRASLAARQPGRRRRLPAATPSS